MRLRWLAAGAVALAATAAFVVHDHHSSVPSKQAAGPTRLPLAEPGVEDSVVRLLLASEGRRPEGTRVDGLVSRYRDGEPLLQLGEEVAAGPEFVKAYGAHRDAEYVDRIYRDLLDRAPRPADRTLWTDQLAAGASRVALLVALSESPEYVARTGTAAPVPPRPLLAPPGIEHSVVRLYLGLQGTWPDRPTLDAAVARYLDGTPLAALADEVLAGRYGSEPSDRFVSSLYEDVLRRKVDPTGLAAWTARLDAGESRGSIAVGFTESPEMLALTRTAPPLPAPIRHTLLAVGDSVMRGAVSTIQGIPGWSVNVDARGCRQPTWRGDGCGDEDIPSGVDALRAARGAGHLGGAVVIQQGNNGPMSAEEFDALMYEVADQRLVIALTLHEPRSYEAGNNAVITAATARWPNLRVLDWHTAASAHPEWFGDGEGIHLSRTGAQAMADLIASALPQY